VRATVTVIVAEVQQVTRLPGAECEELVGLLWVLPPALDVGVHNMPMLGPSPHETPKGAVERQRRMSARRV
jgi:hypothetical protein